MSKYVVHMTTIASLSIEVDVPDGDPATAIDEAFQEAPGDVCAQCGGWGQKWSLDLGEWEIATNPDGSEVQPEKVEG